MKTKKYICVLASIGLLSVGSAFAATSISDSTPMNDQEKIIGEKISYGMSEQQVIESLGKPTMTNTVTVKGKQQEVWIYNTVLGEKIHQNINDSGRYSYYFGTDKVYNEPASFSVLFNNKGRVITWETNN